MLSVLFTNSRSGQFAGTSYRQRELSGSVCAAASGTAQSQSFRVLWVSCMLIFCNAVLYGGLIFANLTQRVLLTQQIRPERRNIKCSCQFDYCICLFALLSFITRFRFDFDVFVCGCIVLPDIFYYRTDNWHELGECAAHCENERPVSNDHG